jgi:hypothetical protein
VPLRTDVEIGKRLLDEKFRRHEPVAIEPGSSVINRAPDRARLQGGVLTRIEGGAGRAPLYPKRRTGYGVGSGYDPPKMSELPNVAGQSC